MKNAMEALLAYRSEFEEYQCPACRSADMCEDDCPIQALVDQEPLQLWSVVYENQWDVWRALVFGYTKEEALAKALNEEFEHIVEKSIYECVPYPIQPGMADVRVA